MPNKTTKSDSKADMQQDASLQSKRVLKSAAEDQQFLERGSATEYYMILKMIWYQRWLL